MFNKTLFLDFESLVNCKATITELYPRILWKLVADALGSADHTLGTAGMTDE